jgi:phospholipid transport system substrate-binding protein
MYPKPIHATSVRISLKVFFVCFFVVLNLFSLQKLYADRVVGSQKLVEDLYNELAATSVKELTIGQQEAELKRLFQKYVDVAIIARAVLGKSWRKANSDQRKRFIYAFKTYVSNKYGKQFSEFKGTKLEIVKSRDTLTKAGVLVSTEVIVPGHTPLKVVWQVSDGSGSLKLIDLRVEGISMLSTERQEFRSKLKKFNGSIDDLIKGISYK